MQDCQHPDCTRDPSDTYKDEHGNTLELCERHYYELVSGRSVPTTIGPTAGVRITQSREQPGAITTGDDLSDILSGPTCNRITDGPTLE